MRSHTFWLYEQWHADTLRHTCFLPPAYDVFRHMVSYVLANILAGGYLLALDKLFENKVTVNKIQIFSPLLF